MSFWCLQSFQKTNENNSTWGTIVVGSNFFLHFLEELKIPKRHFEINWHLAMSIWMKIKIRRKEKFGMKSLYSKSCKWSNCVVFPRDFHFLSWNKLKKVKHYAKKFPALEDGPSTILTRLRKGTNRFSDDLKSLC